MKAFFTFLLLLMGMGCTLPMGLHVASVEDMGLPPHDPANRVYLLGGEGAEGLLPGDTVELIRPGAFRSMGRLRVLDIRQGQPMARIIQPGETYPLVGDLAFRIAPRPLPSFVSAPENPAWPPVETLHPRPQPEPGPPQSGVLNYTRGSAELSPAGQAKLREWAESWGPFGIWTVGIPEDTPLARTRAEAIKSRLSELRIQPVTIRQIPPRPSSRYEELEVMMQPW